MKNSSDVIELIKDPELNHSGLEIAEIFDMLYQDKHFCNLLGDILTKKPSTAKVERFLTQQVKQRLKEIQLDKKIEDSFASINSRIQERLERLRNTKFEIPNEIDDMV